MTDCLRCDGTVFRIQCFGIFCRSDVFFKHRIAVKGEPAGRKINTNDQSDIVDKRRHCRIAVDDKARYDCNLNRSYEVLDCDTEREPDRINDVVIDRLPA